MNETNAGDGGSTSSTGNLVPPPAASPAPAATAAELVGGAAAAKLLEGADELQAEPVMLPRKGAGDRVRNKLLGARARDNWVTVTDPESNEVEECLLMSPTVKQADRIIEKAMQLPDKKASDFKNGDAEISLREVNIDQAELKVQALIACLRDPESRQPLLTQADKDSLLDGPMNYLYAALADEARDMLNPSINRAKKNSKPRRAA